MLSRQVKKRLGDGRQRGGQQCGSVGSPPFGVGRRAAYGRTGPIVANRLSGSGRPSDVAMVEATDFANRDDLAEFRPLNWAAVGRILVEREVSTRLVIVREVAGQEAAQVPFAKDEDVIQALASDRADEPVARQNRVLARWAHVRARLRDSRMLETSRRQGLSAPSGCRPCPVGRDSQWRTGWRPERSEERWPALVAVKTGRCWTMPPGERSDDAGHRLRESG